MADGPWEGRILTSGQIRQRLESCRCDFVKEHHPGAQMWRAPGGQHFSISLDACDAEYLEGIIVQLDRWGGTD